MSLQHLPFFQNAFPDRLDKLALMEQLIRQLEKDLRLEQLDPNLSTTLSLAPLSEWLKDYVQFQLENKSGDFFNALYTIDIEDRMLKIVLDSDRPYENLAQLILQRELYKVMMRQKFKSKEK